MRLKTLGVLFLTALATFIMVYWLTDGARREALGAEHTEELLHFGEIIYSDDPAEPAAAGCARCHGADGEGGPIPNDPDGRTAPSLRTTSLAEKLRINSNYVHLVVSYGGVVVSGNVNSPMPAWSYEVGGPLNEQQIEAVSLLVETWAIEAAENAPDEPVEVEDTVEAGRDVYLSVQPSCASCHGQDLQGSGDIPSLETIGSELVTDLPIEPADLDQMIADYEEDPRLFLERWIRDSAGNYNNGNATGMPAYPEERLSESQLTALITYLLAQTGDEAGDGEDDE